MSWNDAPPPIGEDESDGHFAAVLLDPIGVIRRRWVPMLITGCLGLFCTIMVLVFWESTYRASATVLLTSQQIPEEFVRSTVREDSIANLNAMVGQVLSVENLSNVMEDLGLFAGVEAPRIDLVNRMRANIEMAPYSSSSRRGRGPSAIVYEIAYHSGSSNEAAEVSNALAALFVEASISRRNLQARRTTEFLREELVRDERELREHSAQISEFRREHRGQLPGELQTNLRKIDQLAARIEGLNQQIGAKEDRILSLSSYGGDSVLSETEVLLAELRRELARETAAHTDEHPNVIALRDRIARLEESLSGEGRGVSKGTGRIIESEQGEIARLRDLRIRAEAELASLNQTVDVTPEVDEKLSALVQKEQVLREDYLDALRKVEEAELAESLESAQQGGQVSILDFAAPPSSPERSRSLMGLGGIGATLALVLGVAVLLELIDPVVLSTRQIESASGAPVLGSLPYVS